MRPGGLTPVRPEHRENIRFGGVEMIERLEPIVAVARGIPRRGFVGRSSAYMAQSRKLSEYPNGRQRLR